MKKLMFMLFLFVMLMTLSTTKANALPGSLVGWGAGVGSVIITTEWVGIANTDLKPTEVLISLDIKHLRVYTANHGGGTGGVGQPFDNITVYGYATIADVPLHGRGKYELGVTFSNDFIIQAIIDAGLGDQLPELQNPNWYYEVVVLDFNVRIQGFFDIDDRCETFFDSDSCTDMDEDITTTDDQGEEVVQVIGQCEIQYLSDGVTPDLTKDYLCMEDFHWEYKNPDPRCFYEDSGTDYQCDYDFPASTYDWWASAGVPLPY